MSTTARSEWGSVRHLLHLQDILPRGGCCISLSDYITVSCDTGPACREAGGEEELRHLGGGGGGDGGGDVGGGGWDEWLGRGG